MEARKEKGFRVSSETAPLVEALRLYARMHAVECANFKVEKWDGRNQHIEEIVASTSLLLIARAAFVRAISRCANHLTPGHQGDREDLSKVGPSARQHRFET